MVEMLIDVLFGSIIGGVVIHAAHRTKSLWENGNTQIQNVGDSSSGIQFGGDYSDCNSETIDSVVKTMKDEIFNITGNNIIANSKITVDGKVIFDNTNQTHKVTIIVEGDCDNVKTSNGEVEVKGYAGSVTTTLGNVSVGDTVSGNVETTLGNVTVRNGNIIGNVKTTLGDVRCK